MWKKSWAGMLMAAVVAFAASCDDKACTLIGCGSMYTTELELPVDATELEALSVEVCFEDQCETGALLGERWVLQLGAWADDAGPGGFRASAWSMCETTCQLHVEWDAGAGLVLAAGDHYRVRVTTMTGEVVAKSNVVADGYEQSYPNGKECDADAPCTFVSSTTTVE